MIVDTSALIAAFRGEAESELLLKTLFSEEGLIPAPVAVEYHRAATRKGSLPHHAAYAFLQELLAGTLRIEPFTSEEAELAARANQSFGAGNGRGGTFNLLDLMVYGMAKRLDRAILCTGRDFAATDIAIHPASRSW